MPRPVYIVCSESGSQDAITGLFSLFNVIETLQVSQAQAPPAGGIVSVPSLSLRMTAVWMKNPEDPPEQEYEFQMAIHLPPDGEEHVVQEGRFAFEPEKPLYRMVVIGQGPPLAGPGTLRIESRVRAVGQADWLRQDYPMPVTVAPEPAPATGGEGAPQRDGAANQ